MVVSLRGAFIHAACIQFVAVAVYGQNRIDVLVFFTKPSGVKLSADRINTRMVAGDVFNVDFPSCQDQIATDNSVDVESVIPAERKGRILQSAGRRIIGVIAAFIMAIQEIKAVICAITDFAHTAAQVI